MEENSKGIYTFWRRDKCSSTMVAFGRTKVICHCLVVVTPKA